jgi:hypothetical protein
VTIKRSFHLVYGVLTVLAVALALLTVLLFVNQQHFVASEENRFTSFVVAEELRQSGESAVHRPPDCLVWLAATESAG